MPTCLPIRWRKRKLWRFPAKYSRKIEINSSGVSPK